MPKSEVGKAVAVPLGPYSPIVGFSTTKRPLSRNEKTEQGMTMQKAHLRETALDSSLLILLHTSAFSGQD